MKDGVVVFDLHDRAAGKAPSHAGHEDFPFLIPMVIVDHEKSTAIEILAKLFALAVGEVAVSYFHRVDPGPVEQLVIVQIEVDDLLGGTGVYTGEAAHALNKLAIRLGKVGGPGTAAPPAAPASGGIAKTRQSPFGFLIGVRRNRRRIDLFIGVFAKTALTEQGGETEKEDKPRSD